MTYIINEEVQKHFPQLSSVERYLLAESLENEGQKEPILVYKDMIIDGLERYKIMMGLGNESKIIYDTETLKDCKSLDEAIEYKRKRQLGRRNLSSKWKMYVSGKLYNQYKRDRNDNLIQNKKTNSPNEPSKITPEDLAEQFGCTKKSLIRNMNYAKRIDDLIDTYYDGDFQVKKQILDGDYKIGALNLPRLLKAYKIKPELGEKILKATKTEKFVTVYKEEMKKHNNNGVSIETDKLRHGYAEDLLPNLPKESFQLILTDPPYGMRKDFQGDLTPDEALELARKLAPMQYNLLKEGGGLFLFTISTRYQEFAKIYKDNGFTVRESPIIWIKKGKSGGRTDKGFISGYEQIMYAYKGNVSSLIKEDDFDWLIYNVVDKPEYKPQKPLALLEKLITISTHEGDAVLDPTMGSGSTIVACINTNRKYYGVEKEEWVFNIAKRRIDEAKEKIDKGIRTVDKVKMDVLRNQDSDENSNTRYLNNNDDQYLMEA